MRDSKTTPAPVKSVRSVSVYAAGLNEHVIALVNIQTDGDYDVESVERITGGWPAVLSKLEAIQGKAGFDCQVVVLPDGRCLHRRLTLPNVDDAVLGQMVESQVMALMPGSEDQLGVGWQRLTSADSPVATDDGGDAEVLAVAYRGDVDSVLAFGSGDSRLTVDAATSASLALTTAVFAERIGEVTKPLHVLVYEGDSGTTLVVVKSESSPSGEEQVVRVLDLVSDDDDDGAHAVQVERWQAMLSDAIDLANAKWLALDTAMMQRLTASELEVELWQPINSSPINSSSIKEHLSATEELAAIGGAVAAGQERLGVYRVAVPLVGELCSQADVSRWSRNLRIAVTVAAAWLIFALVGLIVLDMGRADRLDALMESERLREIDMTQVNRDLTLTRFLEKTGPIPLAILDEIARLTPMGMMIQEFSYSREGTFTLKVSAGRNQVTPFITALAKAQTLDDVQLKSQKPVGNNKFEALVEATVNQRFRRAFVALPKADDEEGDRDE